MQLFFLLLISVLLPYLWAGAGPVSKLKARAFLQSASAAARIFST
jgi:hypothetical protein